VPAFCIAHFHARLVDPVDDEVVRLYEVYSCHQHNPCDARLRDILARGLRMGVVAGSDTHRLPLGSLCPDPDSIWRQPPAVDGEAVSQSIQKKNGLQATFAPELSRPALWQAMLDRFTYGTTGARIVMLFSVAGGRMGEVLDQPAGRRPEITVRVGGTADLDEVVVFRHDGRRWGEALRRSPRRPVVELRFRDRPLRRPTVYFLRVRQADGERGWSSPVWLRPIT